jgi:hypothetical protein
MIIEAPVAQRQLRTERIDADLVIVGGGMAGTCAAITAARTGLQVVLVHDRPVLGGNASSEFRLWILGATSHQGNNNRWSREGGVIDELMVENMYRNPDGNALIFDTILLEKVVQEPTLRLLLNTAAYEVEKSDPDRIKAVRAFCSQNSTLYDLHAPLFCDSSGDGILGFLSGAAFRMGAESREEFDEPLAPGHEYGELLGHSLYFYSKDVGRPVKFVPPSFALKDITAIPRYRAFNAQDHGCRLWWVEYGGRMDTVHQTEEIKWELWRIIYGVWNHIKNSGEFPEAETLTLEWVGHVPGKRESRRFEGDYMLTQKDVVERRTFDDAVSYGGWALDLHPADGIYSELPGCNQWHSRGVYQIPYRTLYSRNIRNLFLAGRIISASHVAFGSTRVQATLAEAAQAVAIAAAQCIAEQVEPAALVEPERMQRLQRSLLRSGQYIPGVALTDSNDLVQTATISASSSLAFTGFPADSKPRSLDVSWGQLLPLAAGQIPTITLGLDVAEATTLEVELLRGRQGDDYTPDILIEKFSFALEAGQNQSVVVQPSASLDEAGYVLLALRRNSSIKVHKTQQLLSGTMALINGVNKAVSNYGAQEVDPAIGVESFPFWIPERRPGGQNLALQIEPAIALFAAENVRNGVARPTNAPNAWVASREDAEPSLKLEWAEVQQIASIELSFDTDFDHAMEHVQRGHPESVMPFCIKDYQIWAQDKLVAEVHDNHQTRNIIRLEEPIETNDLTIKVLGVHGNAPAAIFELRCYGV